MWRLRLCCPVCTLGQTDLVSVVHQPCFVRKHHTGLELIQLVGLKLGFALRSLTWALRFKIRQPWRMCATVSAQYLDHGSWTRRPAADNLLHLSETPQTVGKSFVWTACCSTVYCHRNCGARRSWGRAQSGVTWHFLINLILEMLRLDRPLSSRIHRLRRMSYSTVNL